MRKLIKRNVSFLVPMLGLLMISCSNDNFSVTRSPVFSAMQLPGSSEAAVEEHIPGHHAELPAEAGTHGDHDPKHGGTFFMALDNEHHLEGILLSPGIFGVYLYDAYTQPLGRAELHQASGTVQWGDFDGARETPLAVNDVEQQAGSGIWSRGAIPGDSDAFAPSAGYGPGCQTGAFYVSV